MVATLYTRARGETIEIGVADDGAAAGGETLIASSLRSILPGHSTPLANVPDAAALAVSFRPASVAFPVGWLLTLDAATCAALPSGRYLLDLKITGSGDMVTITTPAMLLLTEPATL